MTLKTEARITKELESMLLLLLVVAVLVLLLLLLLLLLVLLQELREVPFFYAENPARETLAQPKKLTDSQSDKE